MSSVPRDELLSRPIGFDAPLTPLTPIIPSLQRETVQLTHTITTNASIQSDVDTLTDAALKTMRQLKLMQSRINDASQQLDSNEFQQLPLVLDRCDDLERIFATIDRAYAMVTELHDAFTTLDKRCGEIERYQGSSASVRKQVGMFFKTFLSSSETIHKMPEHANMEESMPNLRLYINYHEAKPQQAATPEVAAPFQPSPSKSTLATSPTMTSAPSTPTFSLKALTATSPGSHQETTINNDDFPDNDQDNESGHVDDIPTTDSAEVTVHDDDFESYLAENEIVDEHI